jgi:uncharacterized protein with FMN-binding domain
MTKLSRFLFAAAVIGAAAVAAAIHPEWGRSMGLLVLFLLLIALVAAGIFALRSRGTERRSAGKNLSPSLATLSSAAILAVYAAGYHRTSMAAGGFGEQSNRRVTPPPVAIASSAAVEAASQPRIEPSAEAPHSPTLTTRSAKLQSANRPAKNAHDGTGTTAASSPAPPVDYAASPAVAPQARESAGTPAPAADAPQIAMTNSDVNIPSAASIVPAPAQPKPSYKDGVFYGWGSCRHGDIQASVTIQDGKIAAANITQCLTRYSCSWIAALPNQVVKRQSPEVDYVSGASQSTDAFYGAIVAALSKAKN